MARKTPMKIEEIRSIERCMFWIERLAMFLLVIFVRKPWCFHSASALFVYTNSIYLSLFVDRLRIRPYPFDTDEMFYIERFGVFCLAFYYSSSANFANFAFFIAAAFFIMTNLVYVGFYLEPKPRKIKIGKLNSSHASTSHGPNPRENEELKKGKAETDDGPPKEKLEDNQSLKEADGKCDKELPKLNEDLYGHVWDLLKIENVQHEVNHEKEKTEIENNLEGDKVTCHEEEPKKAEDIYDAELVETDEISNASEESWEDVQKKDEEEAAIDQKDELQELKAKCDDMETWEDVEKKAEVKAAIDQEDKLQELKAKCDDMDTWEDVEKKNEEKAAIDQEDKLQELKTKCDYLESELQELKANHEDELQVLRGECDHLESELQELNAICDDMETREDIQKKARFDQEVEMQKLNAKCDTLESETGSWYQEYIKVTGRLVEEEIAKVALESLVQKLVQKDKEHSLKWEEEKKELIANITATSACSTDKIIEATAQLQEMNHKLEEEKRALCAKLEAVTASLEHFQGIENEFEEERRQWNEEKELINEATEQLQEMNRNLEEEKKDLCAKLEAVTASLEHFQGIENDFEEERHRWNEEKELINETTDRLLEMNRKLEEEKKDLYANLEDDFEEERRQWKEEKEFYTAKFEACRHTIQTLQSNANNPENQSKWDKERDDLTTKLAATNSWYQYYMHLCCDVSAKLEYYQTCYNEAEERFRKLREENHDLSAKLCAKTSSVIYFHDRMHEREEECRRLEEEKTNLTSKLCAEKASAELYRHHMRDFGAFGDLGA